MPTYAYVCKSCGHRFDAVQSFSDAALNSCPECEGPLRKDYSSVGVTFKGSGFYRTDSRASAGQASAPAGDSSGSTSSSSSGAKPVAPAASAS